MECPKCPYYRCVKNGAIVCEGGRVKYPDKAAKDTFMADFCGHPVGYKQCPFYRMMDGYYQRKFDNWHGDK